jgi:hypothetical protein
MRRSEMGASSFYAPWDTLRCEAVMRIGPSNGLRAWIGVQVPSSQSAIKVNLCLTAIFLVP